MIDTAEAPRAGWWQDTVTLGRLIAMTVIVLGGALAVWNAMDFGNSNDDIYGPHYALRTALPQVLTFVWYGGLVLIVAEIVSAVRGDDPNARLINWQIPQLTCVLAAVIVVGGTAVTIWNIQAMHDVYESGAGFLDLFSSDPGRTASDDIRYLLEAVLQTYLWQGGLLILLAALADRIGWRATNNSEAALAPPESAP